MKRKSLSKSLIATVVAMITLALTSGLFINDSRAQSYNPCDPTFEGSYIQHDPYDCQYFYVCSFGKMYRHMCAAGLAFDVYTNSCTYMPIARNPAQPCNSLNN